MNIGFVTGYEKYYLELAARFKFDCLEMWADKGTELDVERMTDDDYKRVAEEREKYGVTFDAVVGAGNHLEGDVSKRKEYNAYFIKLIKNAKRLGSEIVMTNVWADPRLSPEANIPLFKEVFTEYALAAEDAGVRIVVENCPHAASYPISIGNICYSPIMWDMMFEAVPSKAIGIEFDPSHMIFQFIDYVKAIRSYGDRIYAFHAKDAEINYERLGRSGIYGRRTDDGDVWHGNGWWRFRMPGLGDVDWSGVFRALVDINYKGPMFIEHEDPVFYGERFEEGMWMGLRFLKSLAPPNPGQMA